MTDRPEMKLARTWIEARAYLMYFVACRVCGRTTLDVVGAASREVNGREERDAITRCKNCGDRDDGHAFYFPPGRGKPGGDGLVFGGPERSELIDPGQWVLLANQIAAEVPDTRPARLSKDLLAECQRQMASAISAVEEAMKFLEGDTIPARSFWSEVGAYMYSTNPREFQPDQLDQLLDRYRARASRYR